MNFSPRILSRHRPDYHCLERILEFPAFTGKTGEALCMALYDFFTDIEEGTYHFWPSNEKLGQPYRGGDVSDPIKLLAVYGWHICGQAADIWYHLCHAAGMRVRKGALPGHVITEVFYEGRWHFYDLDMWVWFRHPDGHIASIAELAQGGTEFTLENPHRSAPCSLPDRPLEGYVKMFEDVQLNESGDFDNPFPNWVDTSHNLDCWLRPGESLTLSEIPQGYVHVPHSWLEHLKVHSREWKGYPLERFAPYRSYGNGVWEFELPLKTHTNQVKDCLWADSGVVCEDDTLTGEGYFDVRIVSPYLFTGCSQVEGDTIRYQDGASLTLSGMGTFVVTVLSPTGERLEYANLINPDNATVDLTLAFQGRYDGVIRVSQVGTLYHWVFHAPIQCAPKALPKLVQGTNALSLAYHDKQGKQTVPWTEHLSVPAPKVPKGEPFQYGLSVSSPISRGFAWFHLLVVFKEAAPDMERAKAMVQWRIPGGPLQTVLNESSISHTRTQWDVGFALEALCTHVSTVLEFQVISDVTLLHVEFTGHLDYSDIKAASLHIEHHWVEGDEPKSYLANPAGDDEEYTIACDAPPLHHVVKMTCKG